jgi:coenzyme F420 hydrogenase subunit beta
MLDLDPWELKPIARVASTVAEIVGSIGPQYLWAPTLDVLNEAIFDRGMENIAVVGTPCTAQAIRKMKHSTNPRLKLYQEAIRLTVSTFCTGIYRPELIEEVLVKGMGVSRDMVMRLELSPDNQWLQAVLWDGDVRTIPLQQAEKYTLSGCGSCIDYLGESADLAVGTLGTSEDMSTLIIRTRTGDVFTRNAVKMNLIETSDEVDMAALDSAANEKDKRERAQEFNDVQLLMLDALADPLKRSEAIQQFVRLYRTPTRTKPQEIVRSDCTGC